MKLRIAVPLCVLALISASALPALQAQSSESTKSGPKHTKKMMVKKHVTTAHRGGTRSIKKHTTVAKSANGMSPYGRTTHARTTGKRHAGHAAREAMPRKSGSAPMKRNEQQRSPSGRLP